jgi:hypothetical protein
MSATPTRAPARLTRAAEVANRYDEAPPGRGGQRASIDADGGGW